MEFLQFLFGLIREDRLNQGFGVIVVGGGGRTKARACACAHAFLLPLISNCCCPISNESHMKTAWLSSNSSSTNRIFSRLVCDCVRECARVCNTCKVYTLYIAYGVALFACAANRVIQSIPILIWLCAYSFAIPFPTANSLPLSLFLSSSFLCFPRNHLILFMSMRAIDSD